MNPIFNTLKALRFVRPFLILILNEKVMKTTTDFSAEAETEKQMLFPMYEVELNEDFALEQILNKIQNVFGVNYLLVKADISYRENQNFGSFLIHLKGEKADNLEVIYYLNQNRITNTFRGFA
ncbi:hypothetical protein ASG01_09145 [Chryseobacterium sp. Leaf180]|jgi:ABC-type methionine transport system ATPase subunit|nr:hypothetical protein ASG01_09145 [Chryseobacterium sp. Leaf180]